MIKSVRELKPLNKKIIVRVDYNLPEDEKGTLDPTRILASISTLSFLAKNNPEVINLLTHFGRPEGVEENERLLKVAKVLLKILQERNLSRPPKGRGKVQIEVREAKEVLSPVFARIYHIPPNFNLYENLRFDKREKENSPDFAKELATLGEVFVNEAFSASHRAHASVVGLANILPSFAGFQVLRELKELEKLKKPERPFVVLIGGSKIEDKLPMLEKLQEIADYVLVGGKVANELLLADKELTDQVILPRDGVNEKGAIIPFEKTRVAEEPPFDIGPETIHLFKSILKDAKTIFWNGNLGKSEVRRFVHGTNEIARFLAFKLRAWKVISGGDTVSAVRTLDLLQEFDFASTGGGATSSYLAGEKLAGIQALEN